MKTDLQKISIILYLVSLITPVFFGNWESIGLVALTMGWMGVFALEITIGLPWTANLIYFSCILIPKKNIKTRLFLSGIMIIFGLFAFGINEIPIDEGGGYDKVYPGFGMLLWLSSFVTLLLFNMNLSKKEKQNI
jgi:hypothetical protein